MENASFSRSSNARREARKERATERNEYAEKLSLEQKLDRARSRVAAGKGICAKEIARLERALESKAG